MKSIILYSLVFGLIITPMLFMVALILEVTDFNSSKIDNWSALFTIISVLLASVLSFISLMVLIVTLKNTQKMTKATFDTLVNQRDDNYISQIESLCQRFNQTLDRENIVFSNNIDCYFNTKINELYNYTVESIIANKITSHDLLLKECKSISENYIGRINIETDLLLSILRSVFSITDVNKQDIAKAIIKDSIEVERRFWFCCMVDEKHNHELFTYLTNFNDFMLMHDNLCHEVFMQEAMSAE